MSELEIILEKLRTLGLEDTKRIGEAVREHLQELDDIAADDAAKATSEDSVPLTSLISEFREGLDQGAR